jgi:predicted nucleic acid-binding protein
MADSFLDTSALVKYYHPEEGTQEVTRIIEEPDSRHSISRLSLVETVSAFAVKYRTGEALLHESSRPRTAPIDSSFS